MSLLAILIVLWCIFGFVSLVYIQYISSDSITLGDVLISIVYCWMGVFFAGVILVRKGLKLFYRTFDIVLYTKDQP